MECQIAMLKTAIDNTATMPMIFLTMKILLQAYMPLLKQALLVFPLWN